MNEFATCIEYLLLDHDCVVVPQLGAFIAQRQPSRYLDGEEIMLPSCRSVRFNSDLAQNNPLLCNSIQQIYGITQEEAQSKIGWWVTEFRQALEESGFIEFGCIGTFTEDEDVLRLTSSESGITTTDLYALESFHLMQIPEEKKKSKPVIETDKEKITIRINRGFLHYAAAACVAILVSLSFSTPADNSKEIAYDINECSLFVPSNLTFTPDETLPSEELTISIAPQEESATSATEQHVEADIQEESLAVEAKVEEPKEIKTEEPKVEEAKETKKQEAEKQPESKYCVVMASAVSQVNATRYVGILQADGYADARILNNGKVIRVVVGSFQNYEDASAAAREIHRRNDSYKDAWVFAL